MSNVGVEKHGKRGREGEGVLPLAGNQFWRRAKDRRENHKREKKGKTRIDQGNQSVEG